MWGVGARVVVGREGWGKGDGEGERSFGRWLLRWGLGERRRVGGGGVGDCSATTMMGDIFRDDGVLLSPLCGGMPVLGWLFCGPGGWFLSPERLEALESVFLGNA